MSKEKLESLSQVQPEDGAPDKKRKRTREEQDDDLEIDVNLPEPPSKKSKRKEKKAEKQKTKQPTIKDGATPIPNITAEHDSNAAATTPKQRSDYGIWIGNLPFSVSKDDLRQFLDHEGGIANEEVVRLHLPPPKDGDGRKGDKNRGFAYIDFTTQAILDKALLLTERLLSGRSVLIKNAKSFEGRPAKLSEGNGEGAKANGGKEPSKRIFVGNLGFDVTREEIGEHFGQAGKVEDVFLATFEDTGKCKGFGWVRFAEIEAAQAAVRGFIFKENDKQDGDGGGTADGEVEIKTEESQPKAKKEKRRKWFINRLYGRELRCEFAEDAHTRYKKRQWAKPAKPDTTSGFPTNDVSTVTEDSTRVRPSQYSRPAPAKSGRKGPMNQDERREERRKRHEKMDARKIAPGQAHSRYVPAYNPFLRHYNVT